MVNTKNVSLFGGTPPSPMQGRAKIPGGPLYKADEVIRALATAPPRFATSKCAANAQDLAISAEQAGQMIASAINRGRYRDSEWCVLGNNGTVAACDAYVLTETGWNDAAHREMECEYYLKFAIGKAGNIVLMISCHTS